jgi:hypothetical protein
MLIHFIVGQDAVLRLENLHLELIIINEIYIMILKVVCPRSHVRIACDYRLCGDCEIAAGREEEKILA